jgi:hypothetical protein
MSEKYSTDDLVRWVEDACKEIDYYNQCSIGCDGCGSWKRKIISRLRVADELAEVATIIADKCLAEYPVSQRMLRKAIADYNINKGE